MTMKLKILIVPVILVIHTNIRWPQWGQEFFGSYFFGGFFWEDFLGGFLGGFCTCDSGHTHEHQVSTMGSELLWSFIKNSPFFGQLTMWKVTSNMFMSFCMRYIFWDDITIICWWKLSKQTSYWSKIGFLLSWKSKQYCYSKYRDIIPK